MKNNNGLAQNHHHFPGLWFLPFTWCKCFIVGVGALVRFNSSGSTCLVFSQNLCLGHWRATFGLEKWPFLIWIGLGWCGLGKIWRWHDLENINRLGLHSVRGHNALLHWNCWAAVLWMISWEGARLIVKQQMGGHWKSPRGKNNSKGIISSPPFFNFDFKFLKIDCGV